MNKIAQITPLRKLPRDIDFFDYEIPEILAAAVKVGSLVEVPFKSSVVQGVVMAIVNTSKFKKLRAVTGVIDSQVTVSDWQVKLIKWFAEYYMYSLSSAVRMFVPEKPTRKYTEKPSVDNFAKVDTDLMVGADVLRLRKLLVTKGKEQNLIINHDPNKNDQLILSLIEQVIDSDKQIIIMVPHVEKIKDILQLIPARYNRKLVVIKSSLFRKKNAWHKTWRDIYTNKKNIIVGTRSAILVPTNKLTYIYINEAESVDYKNWDQNPRYDAINVAAKLASLTKAKLIISSAAPNIETYQPIAVNKQPIITLGKNLTPQELQIIDFKSVRRNEFTYYSPQLIENIKKSLAEDKRVILFLNKRGYSSQTRCNKCDFTLKCPSCSLPLVGIHQQMVCYHCKHKQPMTSKCPKCNKGELKDLGIGIDQVADNLKQIFPDVSLDDPTAKIYLATTLPAKKSVFKQVGFIGVITWDSMLYIADFRLATRFYQQLWTLCYLKRKWAPTAKILLQTALPESQTFHNIYQDYSRYYSEELGKRKLFSYPPYSKLMLIFIQNKVKNICQQEANEIYQQLMSQFGSVQAIKASAPYFAHRQMVRGQYRCNILLKIQGDDQIIRAWLKDKLPDYWTIDIDPINVV